MHSHIESRRNFAIRQQKTVAAVDDERRFDSIDELLDDLSERRRSFSLQKKNWIPTQLVVVVQNGSEKNLSDHFRRGVVGFFSNMFDANGFGIRGTFGVRSIRSILSIGNSIIRRMCSISGSLNRCIVYQPYILFGVDERFHAFIFHFSFHPYNFFFHPRNYGDASLFRFAIVTERFIENFYLAADISFRICKVATIERFVDDNVDFRTSSIASVAVKRFVNDA